MLINQNLSNNIYYKDNYIKLTGPKFALINPNYFLDRKKKIKKKKSSKKSLSILVSMGLTDPYNLTIPVIKSISEIDEKINIHLTLNKKILNQKKLNFKLNELNIRNKLHIHDNLTYLGKLMIKCDLCVGTLGVSSWERCSVGIPTIGIQVSKNQNQILKTLNASGLETNLKRTDKSLLLNLKEIFKNIYKNQNYLRKMTLSSYSLCDGNGVTKVGMLSLNFFNEFHKDRISFQIFNKELHINDEKFTDLLCFFKKNLVGFLKISFNLIQKKIRNNL